MTSAPETADEVALLRRQLARERTARLTAEAVGERSTAELYQAVQRLQAAESELRRRAEHEEALRLLARAFHHDLDQAAMLDRAVAAVGPALEADRCVVRLADGATIGPVIEQWTRPGVQPLPDGTDLPSQFAALCLEAAQSETTLSLDQRDVTSQVTVAEVDHVTEHLGIKSYLGTSMWVGDQLVGWLAVHAARSPREWTATEEAFLEQVAKDLGSALWQAEAYREKAEAVHQLEEADRVKTELVSTVSHELRTPLSSILGYLEVLAEGVPGPLNEQQSRILDVIGRNGRRLEQLVENLLTLARADSVQTVRHHARIDMCEVVDATWRAMAPAATSAGVNVTVTAVAPAVVHGDAEELERLVMNLLANAIKFTPRDGHVAVTTRAAPDNRIIVQVSDTGCGISPEDQPRVFDRFFRAKSASDNAIQGTGLGLAVVKTIVEGHQGTVSLSSEVGAGTLVTVLLPGAAEAAS